MTTTDSTTPEKATPVAIELLITCNGRSWIINQDLSESQLEQLLAALAAMD